MYRHYFVPEARDELRRELIYSKNHYGAAHAENYRQGFQRKIQEICHNPLQYQLRDDIGDGIRLCSYRGNKIFFDVDMKNRTVVIVAILANAQDAQDMTQRRT